MNFIDFYIKYPELPSYNSSELYEDEIIAVIIQKFQMVIYTRKGEVLGYPDFGCDFETLIYRTNVSAEFVKEELRSQIQQYIPEIRNINYGLEVFFVQGPDYNDVMFIEFKIKDFEVNAVFESS